MTLRRFRRVRYSAQGFVEEKDRKYRAHEFGLAEYEVRACFVFWRKMSKQVVRTGPLEHLLCRISSGHVWQFLSTARDLGSSTNPESLAFYLENARDAAWLQQLRDSAQRYEGTA